MSETFLSERLRVDLATWASEVAEPNAAAEAGGVGSWYLRAGAPPVTPVEIYLNLFGTPTGWVKQNLVHISVYNVLDYGALGDGVTDDTDAIWAALSAANTAGGGIVYFPPGSYIVGHRRSALASFPVANMHNLTFLGDGAASRVLMDGDAALADWYMFYITNGSSFIRFVNLYFDGAGVTNPDVGEQTHLVFYAVETTDTQGGPHDGDVVNNYFGTVDGDTIRLLGTRTGGGVVDTPVTNIRIENNSIVAPACRCCVAVQRYSHRIMVGDNFMTGSDDQCLDFEPTGGGAPDNTAQYFVVSGNQIDHSGKNVTALTLNGNGNASPSLLSIFAYNQLHNFSVSEMRDVSRWVVHGNVFLYTAALGGDIGLSFVDGVNEVVVSANVFDRPNRVAQLFRATLVVSGTSTRQRIQFLDNVGRTFGDATGGIAMGVDTANDVLMEGNILIHDNATANTSNGFRANVSVAAVDGIAMIGNMLIATNASMLALFQVSTSGAFAMGNFMLYGNYGRHGGTGIRLIVSGGGSFADWRLANGNNMVAITGSIVSVTSFTSGVTLEGNAGPSSRFLQCAAVPGGAVPSVQGSVALNTGGSNSTVLWYKESAASPTDTAGWIANGPGNFHFGTQDVGTGTGAVFLAPGLAQAAPGATEVVVLMPRPGTLRAIYMKGVAGTGAANAIYTTRLNGADTALAVTVSNTLGAGNASGSIAVVAGDRVGVKHTKSASPAAGQTFVVISLEISG